MRISLPILILIFGTPLLLPLSAPAQSSSIVHSPHNLSAAGPGAIRASGEQQVCIFCHTPHNATPIQPLWNRSEPVSAYTVYSSNSLDAVPGQPTGTSKLCLSCHDGTIAIGSVASRGQPIQMAGGITTLPPGKSNLGTDLSDDHPISFKYDQALVAKDPKLRSPNTLPHNVRLDSQQEMQCTTCHDAHNNQFGSFLVMDNTNSQLCNSCHNQGMTSIPDHVNCNSCHTPHTAPSGPYLLKKTTVTETCTSCHSSTPSPTQGKDIASNLTKLSTHDTNSPVNLPDHEPANTVCKDCHEPHTMQSESAEAPLISPKLGKISGVNSSGSPIANAQFEYEVCFKCHTESSPTAPAVSRQIVQTNTRLEFSPAAVSFHPVVTAGKSSDVPSLIPTLTTASQIYCTSCHASDTSTAAGASGPDGPHGSNHASLLIRGYKTADDTPESANAYALCYSCHQRNSILANQSFPLHSKHVVDERTPCATCHDAHGISSAQGNPVNNAHLISFNTTIVHPDPVTGRLEYRSTGPLTGECYLTCHNTPHSPKSYPAVAGASVPQSIPQPAQLRYTPRIISP